MNNLSYIFAIFFLTLGPVKTIPAFFALTREASAEFKKQAALKSILIATGTCVFIGFVGRNALAKWGVSLDALKIAGGLILLLSALDVVRMKTQSQGAIKVSADTPVSEAIKLALNPLATPIIITPYGVVAIIVFMVLAEGNMSFQGQILLMLFLIMILNYLGMIFADKIMGIIGLPVLRLIGWVFSIMQAALGIDVMLRAFQSLKIIP
jgi:multiple antibiotic resistance protein